QPRPLRQRAGLVGQAEHGLGVGAGDGGGLSHKSGPLDLSLELRQQLGVRLGVHLAAQDLLGAGDGERGDLLAQGLARARVFLVDLGLRRGLLAVALFSGCVARLVDQLGGALLRLGDDIGRALARRAQVGLGLARRRLERLLALLGRGQALGDHFLALLDRAQQRRPDELDREPDEQEERDALGDQRQVDVHGGWTKLLQPPALMTPSSGLPNANSIAMPRPMMNDASIRPSSRKTLACSVGISSGWRAAPSRKRLHMMPTPTQAPSAPRPIISPMPTPV